MWYKSILFAPYQKIRKIYKFIVLNEKYLFVTRYILYRYQEIELNIDLL